MKKRTGYREMIRDRIPEVVNYALIWCKSKDKWISYVYKEWVWVFANSAERNKATRNIMGLNERYPAFNFDNPRDWSNLSDEDKTHWKWVKGWVDWFTVYYKFIKQTYESLIQKDLSKEEIKSKLASAYFEDLDSNTKDKLSEYLIACLSK